LSGSGRFLLYGSYGYTGRLIARLAVERGFEPVLAGRNEEALREQAEREGLRHVVADLDDPEALDHALEGLPLVLHCAGPFSRTFQPMVEACLRAGRHYLDITGEIAVFEAAAELDDRARAARVMLMPGVGFDVVPTDCLAVHLESRLPSATRLTLAVLTGGGVSRGTALSMAEQLGKGGLVRRAGRLTPVPAGWKSRSFDFGTGPRSAVTIPFGDVFTAYYSTGIGDIEVYGAGPPGLQRMLRATGRLGGLLQSRSVRGLIERGIRRRVAGPSAGERARGETRIYGEVADDEGHSASAILVGPEAYDFTALTALAVLEKALAGEAPPGFQTPGKAYGPNLVLGIEGVDLLRPA
jgi:short subunit dehydrogenase-like uncharacterized protein